MSQGSVVSPGVYDIGGPRVLSNSSAAWRALGRTTPGVGSREPVAVQCALRRSIRAIDASTFCSIAASAIAVTACAVVAVCRRQRGGRVLLAAAAGGALGGAGGACGCAGGGVLLAAATGGAGGSAGGGAGAACCWRSGNVIVW